MAVNVSVQPTPNPNAFKFVLNVPVKTRDSVTFKASDRSPASSVKLAAVLLELVHVTEVYFSGSFITVTQDGQADWDDLELKVRDAIHQNIESHDPDFDNKPAMKSTQTLTGDLATIERILDGTIRPALQHDGGDLTVLSLEGKVLSINYQGACGCCPHAAMGTLYAIQNILREQYDPEIVVEMA